MTPRFEEGVVSTVIPVLNRPRMVQEAIASVQQSFRFDVDGVSDRVNASITEATNRIIDNFISQTHTARAHITGATINGRGTLVMRAELGIDVDAGERIQLAPVEFGFDGVLLRRAVVVDDFSIGVGVAERAQVARLKRLDAVGRVFRHVPAAVDPVDPTGRCARRITGG